MSALACMVAAILCSYSSCPAWMNAIIGLGCGFSISVVCYVVGIATNFSHYQSARQELEDTRSAFAIERVKLIHEAHLLALSSATASAKGVFFKMFSDFSLNGTISSDPKYWDDAIDNEILQAMHDHGIDASKNDDCKKD